jgi:hypothetical protein
MKVVSGYNRLVLPPNTANRNCPRRLAVCGAVITSPFEQPYPKEQGEHKKNNNFINSKLHISIVIY